MRGEAVLFSSAKETWATPTDLYQALDQEFRFTFDPCPLADPNSVGLPLWGTDGLSKSWAGQRVFCNPPYGRGVGAWLAKGPEADVAVFLVPSRTDTRWWHEHAMKAHEIRFLRGRLKFGGSQTGAPFPNALVIFRKPPC